MPFANLATPLETYINGSNAKKSALLIELTKKGDDANFASISAQRRVESLETSAAKVESDIAAKTSEIATYTTIIDSLPNGEIKDGFIQKKTLAEQDLYRLNIRARSVGGKALLDAKIRAEQLQDTYLYYVGLHQETMLVVANNP
jgi:hypothetical protein